MSGRVAINGIGVAGTTLAWLLARRGFEVRLHGRRPAKGRLIAVSVETVSLAAELWQTPPERVWAGSWVQRRETAWASAAFERTDSAALVCDPADIVARFVDLLAERGVRVADGAAPEDDADWVITAEGRTRCELGFTAGQRTVSAGWLPRVPHRHTDCTTVVAVGGGWFFACPDPAGGTALMLVRPPEAGGNDAEALRTAVEEAWPGHSALAEPRGAPRECAPQLGHLPASPGKLRVGDAALAIDPLRGDGFGYAARGALLAHAVIAAGDCAPAALRHYSGRLREVFRAHVLNCITHYADARNAAIWSGEIARMKLALELLGRPAAAECELRGFDLRVSHAETLEEAV